MTRQISYMKEVNLFTELLLDLTLRSLTHFRSCRWNIQTFNLQSSAWKIRIISTWTKLWGLIYFFSRLRWSIRGERILKMAFLITFGFWTEIWNFQCAMCLSVVLLPTVPLFRPTIPTCSLQDFHFLQNEVRCMTAHTKVSLCLIQV